MGDRVNARAIAALGGPFHAGEAVAAGASAVLATEDDDFAGQLGDALARAGIDVERSRDVVGRRARGLREERRDARRLGGDGAAA